MSPWLPPLPTGMGWYGFDKESTKARHQLTDNQGKTADNTMPWMFLDWFVPVYLLVSVLVLAGFGACLYFLEPGLQDAHKWSNKSLRHQPLAPTRQTHCRDDDSNALL
ncbi:hypothetical protein QQF64_000756 [Cirrhinus molitorella]|uniref:Uncharacterized protein n=1 Tax=Cirrhinus molitorella TaxID=172907 RepID=A0ABR3NY34_9TELE